MNLVTRYPAVHSAKIERWLGVDQAERISRAMAGWYADPIAVVPTPGRVYVGKDGDFCGRLDGGGFMGHLERTLDALALAVRRIARGHTLYTGFASLDAIIAAATAGKIQIFNFLKSGPTGSNNASFTLWRVGSQPAAGSAGSAAPGGRVPTDATTGAFPYTNPSGADTLHFTSGFPVSSVAGNTLLLYDRIFDVAKTMNSTATEAVTGVPTRYQNTTGNAADSIAGNFLFIETFTALAATAHNWTVCTYKDQADAASTLPSVTGNSGGIVDRLDQPINTWFCPLEAGDSGIKALTQMQCSALVATGAINFVIGHPIAMMSCPIASIGIPQDAIRSALQLARIFDDAALAMLEINKPSSTNATYTGYFNAVAG